jgi:hypothetical protein
MVLKASGLPSNRKPTTTGFVAAGQCGEVWRSIASDDMTAGKIRAMELGVCRDPRGARFIVAGGVD